MIGKRKGWKFLFGFLVTLMVIVACSKSSKPLYKNRPLINAKSDWTEYRLGTDRFVGQWSIAPEVAHDTLEVICYETQVRFEFITDVDSIKFTLKPNSIEDFYIRMGKDKYAHTVIKALSFRPRYLEFVDLENSTCVFKYQHEQSDFLEDLKRAYPLDKLVNNQMSDTEKVLTILNWTNSRWKHSGNNSPSKNDSITILDEAEEGQQFPCFAYAIVLRDQLHALGFKARTIYLKTEDAEHRKGSPGHVATEVFLKDLQKWVFLDGQFNIMPVLNDIPLNGVEFQNAISYHFEEFKLQSLSPQKPSKTSYVDFVYDYLFYFETSLDNRYVIKDRFKINDKHSIMLVPLGAEDLKYVEFWKMDIDYCIYTNSVNEFYEIPNLVTSF